MDEKDAGTIRTYADPPAEPVDVDARGLLCPLPVLRLRKALGAAPPGTRVRLLATDPASQVDVPHFCNQTGHRLVETRQRAHGFAYLVEKPKR